MDDDFGDGAEDPHFEQRAREREIHALKEKHVNTGFLAGLEDASESGEAALQQSFDEGFRDGASKGLPAGHLRGVLSGVVSYAKSGVIIMPEDALARLEQVLERLTAARDHLRLPGRPLPPHVVDLGPTLDECRPLFASAGLDLDTLMGAVPTFPSSS
eukprot:tig00020830_g14445.t1